MSGGITIGGQLVPVGPDELPIACLGPLDHGIEYRPGEGHNRKRTEPIRACVWHWTGGERRPEKMAKVLKRRGYGVEFAISKLGVVYQFADPLEVDTADVGGFNAPSVGVEMVNIGYRRAKGAWFIPFGRKGYQARIHGVRRTFAEFTGPQIRAAIWLAEALSSALPIPRCIPTDANGNLITSTIDVDSYAGHLGHYHVTRRKLDPGTQLLEALGDRFLLEPEAIV